jgi:hypothetical protein
LCAALLGIILLWNAIALGEYSAKEAATRYEPNKVSFRAPTEIERIGAVGFWQTIGGCLMTIGVVGLFFERRVEAPRQSTAPAEN